MTASDVEQSDSARTQPDPDWIGWGPKPLQVSTSGLTKEEIQWCLDGFRKYSSDYYKIKRKYPFRIGITTARIRSLLGRVERLQLTYQQKKRNMLSDEQLIDWLSEPRIRWTDEETVALREAVNIYGREWRKIETKSQGTLLERFDNVQLQRRWEHVCKWDTRKKIPVKQFIILDVVDEFGNPYTVRERYANDAARKAAPLGFELLRVQEKGDDKVYAYKIFRLGHGGVMRISIEDPKNPDYSCFEDEIQNCSKEEIAVTANGHNLQARNERMLLREVKSEHIGHDKNIAEPIDADLVTWTHGRGVDGGYFDAAEMVAAEIVAAEAKNFINVAGDREDDNAKSCSPKQSLVENVSQSELQADISAENDANEESKPIHLLRDIVENTDAGHASEPEPERIAESANEQTEPSTKFEHEEQKPSLKAVRKRLRDELRALKAIHPTSSEEKKKLKIQKEEVKRQLQQYQE